MWRGRKKGEADVRLSLFTSVPAALSGSASMMSEGVHSAIDCGNELLLLYGYRRAARPPDSAQARGVPTASRAA